MGKLLTINTKHPTKNFRIFYRLYKIIFFLQAMNVLVHPQGLRDQSLFNSLFHFNPYFPILIGIKLRFLKYVPMCFFNKPKEE